jgi:hypothetical protein
MKLKFITDTKILFEKEMPESLSEYEANELRQFDEREIISYTIEFNDGVICSDIHDFDDLSLHNERIKQLILKIK